MEITIKLNRLKGKGELRIGLDSRPRRTFTGGEGTEGGGVRGVD